MQIDRIYVSGYRRDLRFTQCCVASIRQWYPDIKIFLIKDQFAGPYDTSSLQRAFDVELFGSAGERYGWGAAKLEPLFLSERKRFLVIDSDVIFAGPVLDSLQQYNEDFIVADEDHPPDETKENYFDPQEIERLHSGFHFPGYVFNTGQFVGTSGILKRSDFLPFVAFEQPRRILQPESFKCGEQGLLNFVVLAKLQKGALTLRRVEFMRWAPRMKKDDIEIVRLRPEAGYPFVMHWAGEKVYAFEDAPMRHVLAHFEAIYNKRVGLVRRMWQRLRAPWHG